MQNVRVQSPVIQTNFWYQQIRKFVGITEDWSRLIPNVFRDTFYCPCINPKWEVKYKDIQYSPLFYLPVVNRYYVNNLS